MYSTLSKQIRSGVKMLFSQQTDFLVLSANPNVNTRVQSRFNQTKHAVTKHLLPTPWITRCLTPNRSQHPSNHLPLLDQNIENWKGYRKKLQITSTDRNTLSWGCFQSSPNPSLQQKTIYKITSDGRIKKPLLVIYLNLPSDTKPADDTIQMKTFTMSFPSFDENQTMSATENALYT